MNVTEELDIELDQEEPKQETAKKPEITVATIIKTWFQTGVATLVIFFLLVTFVVQGFAISGTCMEPNLSTGQRILGNKLAYRFETPSRGDIVVFKCPVEPSKTYIKRVIGLPGETIEIREGKVYINEKHLNEPYLIHLAHGDYGPERVKPGCLFVMGDFRDQSNDSRYWGELPMKNLEAKAWIRYWPISKVNLMK